MILDLEARMAAMEPPYRSKGEAQVGRLLDRYGVPFFYEQPTLIYDRGRYRSWHPDFTLPTYNGLIIEYAGMPEVPDYAAGIRHKRRAYRTNAIPALFIYPRDIQGAHWSEQLYNRIVQAGYSAARGYSLQPAGYGTRPRYHH